jgi:hypothetical protein
MDRDGQHGILTMNQRKLFPIIAGGYRTRVKKALVSKMYPRYIDEVLVISPAVILSGETIDALPIDDFLSITYSVISGDLETITQEMPIINESLVFNPSTILSGELRGVVYTLPTQGDGLIVSAPQVLSGTLNVVVVSVTMPYDLLTVSPPQILSGTLV